MAKQIHKVLYLVDNEQVLLQCTLALVDLLGAHVGPPHRECPPAAEAHEGGDALEAAVAAVLVFPALQGHEVHLAVAGVRHAMLADGVVVLLVDVLVCYNPEQWKTQII